MNVYCELRTKLEYRAVNKIESLPAEYTVHLVRKTGERNYSALSIGSVADRMAVILGDICDLHVPHLTERLVAEPGQPRVTGQDVQNPAPAKGQPQSKRDTQKQGIGWVSKTLGYF